MAAHTIRNVYDCSRCGNDWETEADNDHAWSYCPHCDDCETNPSCSEIIEIEGETVTDQWLFLVRGTVLERAADGSFVHRSVVRLSKGSNLIEDEPSQGRHDLGEFEGWCAERGIPILRIDGLLVCPSYIKPIPAPIDMEFKLRWL